MAKILLVEDDLELCRMVVDWLRQEHYDVEAVHNGRDGLDRLQASIYDAILLDWDLPAISGLEICKQFRNEGGSTPVIMLTGKGLVSDKEMGLDSGADDYLTKPFNMRELSARLRVQIRRGAGIASASNILKIRDIELDPKQYVVRKAGLVIKLLPKEFALLEFFMRHPNQPFSGEALMNRIWSSTSESGSDAFRSALKRLRKKLLDNDDNDPIIETVHGVGYRLRG